MKCATTEQHRRGLLRICQDVHMTLLGTYERSYETGSDDMTDDVRYLIDVVKGWEPSDSAYDEAVCVLVTKTVAEVQEYANRKLLGTPIIKSGHVG